MQGSPQWLLLRKAVGGWRRSAARWSQFYGGWGGCDSLLGLAFMRLWVQFLVPGWGEKKLLWDYSDIYQGHREEKKIVSLGNKNNRNE